MGIDRFLPLPAIFWMQVHSCQYGWFGFNQTSLRGNNHISANILKFGGMSCRLVGRHVEIVDRAEIDGYK